jgi:iron(III) transport system substrate-binding protein
VALGLLAVAACAPAQQPAQPAKPAEPAKAVPPAPQAAPAKPAEPAKPAAQPAKPAAQAPKPAASAEPDAALVEAAKKEGKLTWYTALELTAAKQLASQFEKKYGIQVEVVRNGGEPLFSQFLKEADSNIRRADVFATADTGQMPILISRDLIAPYRPKGIDAVLPQYRTFLVGPNDSWFTYALSGAGLIYNTAKVKEADAPKAWRDLLDPKWKGKIVQGHPNYSGVFLTSMHLRIKVLGEDYFRQLAKNEPLIVQSVIDVATRVVSGERDIGAGASLGATFQNVKKGNPIKLVYPTEGLPMGPQPVALVKHAPHPNAAKLFLEYMLSPEFQEYLAFEGGYLAVRPDVKRPEYQEDPAKIKMLFADPVELEKERERLQKLFKDIFGV